MTESNWGFTKNNAPPWPKKADGEPVAPAYLTHLSETDFEGQIVVSMLNAAGIPVVSQYPLGGEFGRVIMGMSGTGRELYVPETMLEDAREMLTASFEEDAFDDVQE